MPNIARRSTLALPLALSVLFVASTARAQDATAPDAGPPGEPDAPVVDAPPVVDPPVVDPPVVDPPVVDAPVVDPPVVDAPPVDAAPAPAPAALPLTGYDNGFFIRTPDGNHRLALRGIVQPRFSVVAPDSNASTWTASFSVQRAQMEMVGHSFTPDLQFLLRVEFGRGEGFIRDAQLDWRFTDTLFLRGGLWRRPFSRQQMSVDWRLAFLDRAITDAAFAGRRDLGVGFHSGLEKSPPFEWAFGVFSGATDRPSVLGDVVDGTLANTKITNVPALFTPTLVARVGWNTPNARAYTEIDEDGGPFRGGAALSVLEAVDVSGAAKGVTRVEADGIAKIEHVDVSGAVYVAFAQDAPSTLSQRLDLVGAHVQGGVLLFDRVHPGVRYAVVTTPSTGAVEHEILANVTYLVFGQNVSIGGEAGSNVKNGVADARVRVQGQLQF